MSVKISKFLILIFQFACCARAEWIEVTRIMDDSNPKVSHNILSKSNFMHEIQPMANLNPIIKNSYVLDEILNLSNKTSPSDSGAIKDAMMTTTTSDSSANKIIIPIVETTTTEEITDYASSEPDQVYCTNCTIVSTGPTNEPTEIPPTSLPPPPPSDMFNFIKSKANWENIFAFMSHIQQSFNATTWHGKIDGLHTLKSNLISTIENRLESLYPVVATGKATTQNRRRRRGIVTSEGHMDFPSAEGALITICFLTFAVFLIKLVLQVINTIKSKHYNYNGLDQATVSAVKMLKANKLGKSFDERSARNLDTEKILSSIYNYKTFK